MAYTVIAEGEGHSALLDYQQEMRDVEATYPEGSPMQLQFDTAFPTYTLNVYAAVMNDRLRSKGVTLWPGATTYTTVSGSTVTLRWVKEGLIIDFIIAVVLPALFGIFGWSYLKKWIFSTPATKSGSSGANANSAGSTSSPTLLGDIHWWGWVLLGIGAFAVARALIKLKDDEVTDQ